MSMWKSVNLNCSYEDGLREKLRMDQEAEYRARDKEANDMAYREKLEVISEVWAEDIIRNACEEGMCEVIDQMREDGESEVSIALEILQSNKDIADDYVYAYDDGNAWSSADYY